jgi:8-oxo-dGTP pyrophosphatase MutT (NUDIX family)
LLAPKHFSAGPGPLIRPVDAVAALLVPAPGRYVMQLRDDRPDIIYPGHWACFGGALRAGEAPLEALRRELREELELEAEEAREFGAFDFDLGPSGLGRFCRRYFVVETSEARIERCVLHEGAALRVFSGEELLRTPWVAPHDAFAVWLHAARNRVAAPPGRS